MSGWEDFEHASFALEEVREENERLRARTERLVAALRTLVLHNGHTYGCMCSNAQCTLRRAALSEDESHGD